MPGAAAEWGLGFVAAQARGLAGAGWWGGRGQVGGRGQLVGQGSGADPEASWGARGQLGGAWGQLTGQGLGGEVGASWGLGQVWDQWPAGEAGAK